jgi:hypothetical protein
MLHPRSPMAVVHFSELNLLGPWCRQEEAQGRRARWCCTPRLPLTEDEQRRLRPSTRACYNNFFLFVFFFRFLSSDALDLGILSISNDVVAHHPWPSPFYLCMILSISNDVVDRHPWPSPFYLCIICLLIWWILFINFAILFRLTFLFLGSCL